MQVLEETMECEVESDAGMRSSADVYAGRVVRTLNSGFIALLMSIGHRTGLFDVLAALPPSTSSSIAKASGLAERYVREWLAAMVAAHIVQYDARTNTYFLRLEYAAVLSRGAGANDLAASAELLSVLASVEDLIVAGFRSGGGVVSEAFDRVNAILSAEKRKRIDDDFLTAVLDLVPGLARRLDIGTTVLDAGCGDGALLIALARAFPRSEFRGYDVSRDAIAHACEQAGEVGVKNVEFATGDVASLEEPRAYELVLAFEALHEMAFPRLALRRILASLRSGGTLIVQEAAASSQLEKNVEHPFAPMLYAQSCLHTVPVALASDGDAPGRMWGRERMAQMLNESGFRNVRFEMIAGDSRSMYVIVSSF